MGAGVGHLPDSHCRRPHHMLGLLSGDSMAFIIAGLLLVVLGLAGAMQDSLAGILDFGMPWFSRLVPLAVLGGLWTQRGGRRFAVVPMAVALFLLMNAQQLGLGTWSHVAISGCGLIVLAVELRAGTSTEKARDRRALVITLLAALLALGGLYVAGMILH
jgi:hypothetical protein